jgi:surface antigen
MGKAVLLAAMGAILLSACQNGQHLGAAGANSGVIVGSEVASGVGEAPIGAVEGISFGADLGRSLQESDRPIALRAEYEALEYSRAGEPTEWRNPETGNSGNVVVGASYEVNRLDCREYTHTVSIGGRTRVAKGTACRQPGGTWRMLG